MTTLPPESSEEDTPQNDEPAARGAGAAPAPRSGIGTFLGRANPRPKEQEVLEVATEYFLRHGYEGASINAMARSSGISKESIYRYFSSKKQLFEAVVGRELLEYQARLRRLDTALQTMDLRAALTTIGETVLGVITSDRTLALRRLIFEEATRSPDVGELYHRIGPSQAEAALVRLFEAHRVQAEIDTRALAAHFLALLSWRIVLERECNVRPPPTHVEIERWVAGIVDDFSRAFLRKT